MSADATYQSLKSAHASLPAFQPLIPTSALPTIAFAALCISFALTFFLTTLPKSSRPADLAAAIPVEMGTALAAAFLAGVGAVALFCTVGVYV